MDQNTLVRNNITGTFLKDIEEIAAAPIDWSMLEGKSITITGASGFISSHLVLSLLLRNDDHNSNIKVIGLVRSMERAEKKYGNLLGREDLILVEQDVCDDFDMVPMADYVIHAASQASNWHFENDPVGTIRANLVGTDKVLRYALQNKAEVLIVSSLKTYGLVTDGSHELMEETQGYVDPDSYKNCYAMGKRASETLAASYSKQYGLNIKIVRPSYIYGAASLDDDRVWAQFIANVVKGENILLKSNGAPYRSFCYVTDTATAMLTVLLKGQNLFPYNISSKDSNITIRDFAKKAVEAFPEKGLTLSFANPEDAKEVQIDYTKQTPEIMNSDRLMSLGWNANVNILQGIKRAVAILTEK